MFLFTNMHLVQVNLGFIAPFYFIFLTAFIVYSIPTGTGHELADLASLKLCLGTAITGKKHAIYT